jgi:hypothetical protein
MCIPPQVPPAPANGEPEGHPEDIPPQVRGVAGPGGVQDPLHFDVADQGVVDHLQPLVGVSHSHISTIEPPFDQLHPGNRTLHMYSPM